MSASRGTGSFKAQGQARLEELIRDAKLGKKIKQVKLLICSTCVMSATCELHGPSSASQCLMQQVWLA